MRFDYDNDGRLDLFVCRFVEFGKAKNKLYGMAIGDFNNDGAVDVLVAVNNGQPLLLKNVSPQENRWLGLRLIGKKRNSDQIGSKISWQARISSGQTKSGRRQLPFFA